MKTPFTRDEFDLLEKMSTAWHKWFDATTSREVYLEQCARSNTKWNEALIPSEEDIERLRSEFFLLQDEFDRLQEEEVR